MAEGVEGTTNARSRNLTPTYETDEDEGPANVSVLSQSGLDLVTTRTSSQESGLTAAMVVFRVRFPTQSTSVVETTASSRLDEALSSLMQRFRMAPATLQARRVGHELAGLIDDCSMTRCQYRLIRTSCCLGIIPVPPCKR
jgi:hypothetical protein